MKRILNVSVDHPYPVIAVTLLITLFFAVQISQVRIDPRVEIFLKDDNPIKADFHANMEEFNTRDATIVGVIGDDIYNIETLRKIEAITAEIEQLPKVERVTNILNLPHITGTADGMAIEPLSGTGKVPESAEEMALLKQRVNSWEFYNGFLITEDRKGSLISFVMDESVGTSDLGPTYHAVKNIVERYAGPEQFFISGAQVAESLVGEYITNDLALMIPIVALVIILVLYAFFRNIRGVLLPLLTVGFSVIWTVGLMGILKLPMTNATNPMPIILMALGTAYGIHVLENVFSNAVEGKTGRAGLLDAIYRVSQPIIIAGLTTMAGFIALTSTEIIPFKHFGFLTAFGTFAALVISLTFIPAVLSILNSMGKEHIPHHGSGKDFMAPVIRLMCWANRKASPLILALDLIVILICIGGAFYVKGGMDPIKVFRPSSDIRRADTILNQQFGGTTLFKVVLRTDELDGIKDPVFLNTLEDLQNQLNQLPGVGKTISCVDFIKRMNQAMHGEDPAYYKLPPTRELIAQYMLLYSFSGGSDMDAFASYDYDAAQIMLQIKSQNTELITNVLDAVDEYGRTELADSPYKLSATGISMFPQEFNRVVIKSQITSTLISLLLVTLITSLIFRSLKLGLLSVMPLLVPIILNFGIMGFLKIPLNAPTSLIASVGIGVGIDYSIHFISRYRHERLKGLCINDALQVSLNTSGRAICYNAMTVAAGMLMLIPSNFLVISQMGLLIAITMFASSIAAITMLPAIIKLLGSERIDSEDLSCYETEEGGAY